MKSLLPKIFLRRYLKAPSRTEEIISVIYMGSHSDICHVSACIFNWVLYPRCTEFEGNHILTESVYDYYYYSLVKFDF